MMPEYLMFLISQSVVSNPGGQAIRNDEVPVLLRKDGHISRLSFNLIEPVNIDMSSYFVFSMTTKTPDFIVADILKGDMGMPEINFENVKGQVYRFKRGNLKDFILKVSNRCENDIELPCDSFLYNQDLKSNVALSNDFFDVPIRKVYFDFLSNSAGDIELSIVNPRFVSRGMEVFCASKLIDIVRVNNASKINSSLTETGKMSFYYAPNSLCSALYSTGVRLEVDVYQNANIIAKKSFDFFSKVYFDFNIPKLGYVSVDFRLLHKEKLVAQYTTHYVRTLPNCSVTPSIGMSDGANFEGISHLGSYKSRIVINLATILKAKSGYEFSGNNNSFRNLLLSKGQTIYVALKGMPKWLSSRSSNDYSRYGPSCYNEYYDLIQWIVGHFSKYNNYVVETWNEANVSHEWNDTITVLSEVHKTAYRAIKSVNPSVQVLSPSSTSWDFEYFNVLHSLGVYDYSDGLAMHGYTYTPEAHAKLFEKLSQFVEKVSQGRKSFAVHITEIGFRVPAFSEVEQAEYFSLFSLYSHFLNNIECLLWFRYQNLVPESGLHYDQNSSSGYAMLGYCDSYARPSYAAFRWLTEVLSKTVPRDVIVSENDVLFVGYFNERQCIRISYCEGMKHELSQEFNIEGIRSYDMYGNELSSNEILENKLVYFIEKLN
ncbi:hypothetical protein [Vibrio parahaemolyticus]|nr:hypothetical protein [Vibrio parahaemolyticus]MCG6482526.1 hypothetical protein [Vibrio parahaemolyticus]HCG6763908.1 hypothetical protein [Vibrio parahaemolyticus]HCM0843424.1 hypothetical protein [Vibrio parahaemolyticus]